MINMSSSASAVDTNRQTETANPIVSKNKCLLAAANLTQRWKGQPHELVNRR